jgi:hypothetical protein
VFPANDQKHRENNGKSPFHGIIGARENEETLEKPCTCGRAQDVQTAHWTSFNAGIT